MKRFVFFLCGGIILVGTAFGELTASSFPTTIDDASFKTRIENATDGYKPFLDKKTYQDLNVVPGEEMYTDRILAIFGQEIAQQQDAQRMNIYEYCAKYPNDENKCQQITSTDTPTRNITYNSKYTIGGTPVVANNSVIGGSCYPADHDTFYKNKIFTSGRFEQRYPAFEKALITLFRKEGTTCGTIPMDPGAFTCMGISSVFQKIPPDILKRYTVRDAEDLYYERFWNKYKLYKLPDVIAGDIFLAGVASGMGTALQNFRVFLGLSKNAYAVDDKMVNAVKNYKGDIHNNWMNLRERQLKRIAATRYKNTITYEHAVEIKRKNGCHVKPQKPLYRR